MIIRSLALLLLVQLALVAAVYWPRGDGASAPGALVGGLDRSALVAVSIDDNEGSSITLSRDGDTWRLPAGLPADSGKMATLLTALLDSDPGFAIASSDAAAIRFDVAANGFERRIVLESDDRARTVFLGSSPAFRKVHARLDGESAVYVLDFNSYDAPTDSSGWLDRSLLALRDLERISLDDSEFALDKDSWLRSGGAPVDSDAMEALLMTLAGLQVSGINGDDNETAQAALETLSISGTGRDGVTRSVALLANDEAGLYYLRGGDYDLLFNTSSYDAERLVEAAENVMHPASDDGGDDTDADPAVDGP